MVDWREIRNPKLRDLYSTYIFKVTKSRGMRWAGYMAGIRKNALRVLVGKAE
jgi:hypothetical protein